MTDRSLLKGDAMDENNGVYEKPADHLNRHPEGFPRIATGAGFYEENGIGRPIGQQEVFDILDEVL